MTSEEFILVYVFSNNKDDLNAMRNKYSSFIEGNSHVQCREHRCPLIFSNKNKLRCECEKNLPIHVVATIVTLESVRIVLNNFIKTSSHSLINIK